MADTLFIVPFQMWFYQMLYTLAGRLWLANRAGLLGGLAIQLLDDWILNGLFGPSIRDFSLLSRGLLPTVFTLAVVLLAMSYLVAPYLQVRVVDPQKAVGWLLFALLFYQLGPGLYVEGERLRRGLAGELYSRTLAQASEASGGGPLGVLASAAPGPDEAMGALANQFGAFSPNDTAIDGLDIAMAFTLSTGDDVLQAATPLPEAFAQEYFDPARGPLQYLAMSAEERSASLNQALAGLSRLLAALILIFFGLCEQLVYLCLSLAVGMLFVSMSIAILFAFFERTEGMARSLVEMWLELFIFSAIVAVIQAFTVGFVTAGARTLNPTATLGAALVGGVVMAVLLVKAAGTVWDALNRLFAAMSRTVGGGLLSPAQAGLAAAGALGGAALTVATGGAGAAVTALAGGSLSQAAGSALAGSDALFGASAIGSMVLPDASPLKRPAAGFYEGALSNRLLGPVGGLMLRRQEGQPASVQATGGGTAPPPGGGQAVPTSGSLDTAGIKEAIRSAMQQAIAAAPPGGYGSQQEALQAVRDALGSAARSPRLDDAFDRRSTAIAHHVRVASQAGPTTARGAATTPGARRAGHE